jgi:uncharacterized SAM-dependent methyltransferase
MNSGAIPVVVHANQFPTAVSAQVAAALRRGELPGKLHYSNWRQARAWLAVHHRYAPYFHARDGRVLYERAAAGAVARLPRQPTTVISLGCGAGQKDTLLLRQLTPRPTLYVPVDAGLELLLEASNAAMASLEPHEIQPQLLDLAASEDWADALRPVLETKRLRVLLCYGMLPGMDPAVAGPRLSRLLRQSDLLLLSANLAPGLDAAQGAEAVLPLYDNPETRAWLSLALEDIGLDPRVGTWQFAVTPDASLPGLNRIEVTFTPAEEVTVRLGPETVPLRAEKPLVILRSNRFTAGLVEAFAHACGLSLLEQHLSQAGDEGVFLLARPGPRS